MMTHTYTSALANWDGRLSSSTTEQKQSSQGSRKSIAASATSSTPVAFLDSTHAGTAAASTSSKLRSAFSNERRRADKGELGDALLEKRRRSFQSSLLAKPASTKRMTPQRTVPFPNTNIHSHIPGKAVMLTQTSVDEEDDDDELAVNTMLENASPLSRAIQPSSPVSSLLSPRSQSHESRFTSPAHVDKQNAPVSESAHQALITPRKLSRGSRRVLDYVAVPPLPIGVRRVDYEDSGENGKRKLDHITRLEAYSQNPIFQALSAGLRHNAGHSSTYTSDKGKGKARVRSSVTDSDYEEYGEEDDHETIFISRPLKRKGKSHETDEDDRRYGSPPKKREFTRPKASVSASSSSAHVPLIQAPSKTDAKQGVESETDDSDRDLLLLDIVDMCDPPLALLPTTLATLTSIRHLRKTKDERANIWAARFIVGKEYLEPSYAADDIPQSSSPSKKIPKPNSYAHSARNTSPAMAQLDSPTGRSTNDTFTTSSGVNGLDMIASGKSRAYVSPSVEGKVEPGIQAVRRLTPSANPSSALDEASSAAIAKSKTPPSPTDRLTSNIPLEMEVVTTDADGDVNMDYFLNDLENNSAIARAGTALFDTTLGNKEQELHQSGFGLVPAMSSSASGAPLLAPDIYSSEAHVHTDHPNQSTTDGTYLSGPDCGMDGDDGLYPTSNDFINSPWISGGSGDLENYSPIGGTTGSSIADAWNGTIDPSLLGGGELAEPLPLSPSPSPPPAASDPAVDAESSSAHRSVQLQRSDLLPGRHFSQRIPRSRHEDNYVDIDELDLSGQSDSDTSSADGTEKSDHSPQIKCDPDPGDSADKLTHSAPPVQIHESASTSPSGEASNVATAPPLPAPKRTMSNKRRKRTTLTKSNPNLTWCHQCRRNTLHDKMKCTNIRPAGDLCQQRFCTICIEKRYPDILFDSGNQNFICPKCTNTCNCTACTAKRGEKYISSRGVPANRGGGVARSIPSRSVPANRGGGVVARSIPSRNQPIQGRVATLRNTTINPASTQNPEPPLNATKYWGTIYGTSGEKIGTAFVGEEDDVRVVVRRSKKSGHAQAKKRMFIGQVQDSWGFADHTIKDVVDDSRSGNGLKKGKGKGKGKGKAREPDPLSIRTYIGKKPPRLLRKTQPIVATSSLVDQSRATPVQSGDFSDLTPLSSPFAANWPEPAVGESAYFGYDAIPVKEDADAMAFEPELGLSPDRMEVAIALGLSALQPLPDFDDVI